MWLCFPIVTSPPEENILFNGAVVAKCYKPLEKVAFVVIKVVIVINMYYKVRL